MVITVFELRKITEKKMFINTQRYCVCVCLGIRTQDTVAQAPSETKCHLFI